MSAPGRQENEKLKESGIFRREALEHHLAGRGEGEVLRIAPTWTRWTYPVLIVVSLLILIGISVVHMDEYASGPAVIELVNAADVSSPVAGTVVEIHVRSGDEVRRGEPLITLNDEVERADLERLEAAWETQLVNFLRDRTDRTVEQALISLRSQLDLARARLRERSISASSDGVVSDIRVRVNQVISPGQSVLGMLEGEAKLQVIAMLPGNYRPLLQAGTPMRLELSGYPYAYQELTIDRVADEVIGPSVARSYLRPKMIEAVSVSGSVVLVWASLESRTFVAAGAEHPYFDGQIAQAEARVKSESILVTLVPGLKFLLEKFHV